MSVKNLRARQISNNKERTRCQRDKRSCERRKKMGQEKNGDRLIRGAE